MKKPALVTYRASDSGLGVIDSIKLFSLVLQKYKGIPIQEAREQALEMVLGTGPTAQQAIKKPRSDYNLRKGGPPWVTIASAADSFGISRRTIERWVRCGCTIVLESGQVLNIVIKRRHKNTGGRGWLVSLAQLQLLLLARKITHSPGRKLPGVRVDQTFLPQTLDEKAAKNMWRCGRAFTLLRGVTDAEMLRRVQTQLGLLIRRRRD